VLLAAKPLNGKSEQRAAAKTKRQVASCDMHTRDYRRATRPESHPLPSRKGESDRSHRDYPRRKRGNQGKAREAWI
jgi:hypothetical protein